VNNNTDETDPFARLESTHRRLEQRIAELLESLEALDDPKRSSEAIAIIEETIGFFGRGGRRHVEDEEKTLFPRIRRFEELGALLERLGSEHEAHQRIEDELRAIADDLGGRMPDPEQKARLAARSRDLAALYAKHIAAEEQELFPACRRLLPPAEVEAMGAEMMARRPDRGKDKR
jgi:hemerythrin-like domain-containing protein